MRDLLGGKGAGLAEMTNAGLPVPPGFTITTAACTDYFAAGEQLPDGLWDDILARGDRPRTADRQAVRRSRQPPAGIGPLRREVLMPGMMDTVLNLGLNPETGEGLSALTGDPRFGWDAYRRFIQMFGRIVLDVDGAAVRTGHREGQAQARRRSRQRPRRRCAARGGRGVPRPRPEPYRPRSSRPTRSSSSTWP